MSYHDELKVLAESIGSDGCTHATQVHQDCCWEHDWAYVTGTTPRGVPCTKAEADRRFRDCNQAHSRLRWLSPLAWVRWTAVALFGGGPLPQRRGLWSSRVVDAAALVEARAARERLLTLKGPR